LPLTEASSRPSARSSTCASRKRATSSIFFILCRCSRCRREY
jgi:hypothetical protein